MNTRKVLQFMAVPALLYILPVNSYAVNFTTKSEKEIRGDDPGMNVKFSSVLEGENYVVVDVKLRNEKKIVAEIDYTTQTISIKSLSQKNGAPVKVTKQDIFLINMLSKSLGPVSAKTGDALASTLSFLSEAPPGEVVDISLGDGSAVQPQAVESLCEQTGDMVTGTYDTCRINPRTRRCVKGTEQTFDETEQLGPCYNESNECLGRCGRGCDVPPSATIQRFAQDCLNHDLCTREAARDPLGILPPCNDEWVAAADDFVFAADCGSMTGGWIDNFGFTWSLTQSPSLGGLLFGSVDATVTDLQCGTWTVSGTHLDADVSLTATNPEPIEEGCCTAFTYTGTLNSCGTAGGTWTNECEVSGEWSMSREGATLGTREAPLPEGKTPASSNK